MSEALSGISGESPFDRIKHVTAKGADYWMARELQIALDYSEWDKFENVLEKAQIACSGAGEAIEDHFRQTAKMIEVGKGGVREIRDYFLTRYACYLIAMNASSSKKVIAEAQTYFAIQTRRQEQQDKPTEEQKRIALRDRVKNVNIILNHAAHECGVENFARFQDAGYQGLYGGYGVSALKKKKGVPHKNSLLDHMGREELAANEFRITQTEKKLRVERIQGEDDATDAHKRIGKQVRQAIIEIGGTMPEQLPAEQNIAQLTKKKEHKALIASLKEPKAEPERLKRPSLTPGIIDAKWKSDSRVVLVGVVDGKITEDGSGYQHFDNLEAAREIFSELDTHKECSLFTAAMGNPKTDIMRFETWQAYDYYSEHF